MRIIILVLVFASVAEQLSMLCKKNLTHTSCSDMIFKGQPEDACVMKFYKLDGEECTSLSFNHSAQNTESLGNVRLHANAFSKDFYMSSIDVVFTNISWNTLSMRFYDESHTNKRIMCRTFTIWDNITVSNDTILKYDCPWYNSTHSGRNYTFEYEMTKGDLRDVRKFNLVIPSYKDMDDTTDVKKRKVFSYIDVTNTQMLQLRMQTLPEKYNVSEYKVEAFRQRSDYHLRQDVRMIKPDKDEVKFDYNTWDERGYYYFLISFIGEECPEDYCTKTASAKVYIGKKSNSLVIGMVGALIIIASFLYIIFIYNRQSKRRSNYEESDTNVLFIYLPSIEAHNRIVLSLAELLQKVFKLSVLVDVNDIPKTENKDPLKWCNDAFESATHIVYIASPEKPTINSIYRVYTVLLRFLHEEITKTKSPKKISCITFPYSLENIPDDLKVFRRFDLMKNFDDFIAHLTNDTSYNWCTKAFKRKHYSSEPLYTKLKEEVQAISNEPEITKMPVHFVKPEIKVTDENNTSVYKEKEMTERDSLILNENCTYNIDDLDLSGGGGDGRDKTVRNDGPQQNVHFNIDELNL